jgi:hypothetical protein
VVSKTSISYTVTFGMTSVDGSNSVPICHCQCMGVAELGRHMTAVDVASAGGVAVLAVGEAVGVVLVVPVVDVPSVVAVGCRHDVAGIIKTVKAATQGSVVLKRLFVEVHSVRWLFLATLMSRISCTYLP